MVRSLMPLLVRLERLERPEGRLDRLWVARVPDARLNQSGFDAESHGLRTGA
jgi:hypothetical protein